MAAAQNEPGRRSTTEQLRDKSAEVQENLRDMGSHVRDAAQEKIGQLRDRAQEYYQQGRERISDWEESLEDYVRERPLQSILIAAGVGVVFGWLWRRR